MDELKSYEVNMEWDSYEGSPYKETHTSWYDAYNEFDARCRANNQFGYKKGFKITNCSLD